MNAAHTCHPEAATPQAAFYEERNLPTPVILNAMKDPSGVTLTNTTQREQNQFLSNKRKQIPSVNAIHTCHPEGATPQAAFNEYRNTFR